MSLDTHREGEIIFNRILGDYGGEISRYTLEGLMLYEYNYSNVLAYTIILNLVGDGRLKLIKHSDGEYYKILR